MVRLARYSIRRPRETRLGWGALTVVLASIGLAGAA
jgi:hypothetical protein